MSKKSKILFVCTGNSARSQIAEGFARYYGGSRICVDSAGTNPVGINPYSVWVMNESGIDISRQTSDTLDSKNLTAFDYVITLCGSARDHCPVLPAQVNSEHWDLPDPAVLRGKPATVIASFRLIRNEIEKKS